MLSLLFVNLFIATKKYFKSALITLQNQFPTREQRLELSRVCNDAELAMNNGAMIRGPEGDTEGITEQRINTWFTNRRKGLTTPITPSPTKGTISYYGSLYRNFPIYGRIIYIYIAMYYDL